MKRAETLAEIYQSCHPRPLRREELETFFVDTDDARDKVLSRRDEMRRRLTRDTTCNTKILLAGHAGCGKSTELVKLAEELKESFFTVSLSAAEDCNLYDLVLEDVLVVMMERILSRCEETSLSDELDPASTALAEVHRWFAEELDIEEKTRESGFEGEGGIDASQSHFGKLLGLLIKMKARIRRADKSVHRMCQEKPHRWSDLVQRCNLLVKEVQHVLHGHNRRMLIVIEDMDKANLNDARRIFFEQPAALADIETCMICTVPIFLRHSADWARLDQHFESLDLPMLKVSEFDGEPCGKGRHVIRDIIGRRIAPHLIDGAALDLLIDKCGGVLRDVFEVLVVAAQAAESACQKSTRQETLTEEDVRYGLNRRKNEYTRAISAENLPEEWTLTVQDLYAKLEELRDQPVRAFPAEPVAMVLLKAKAVLEYNGEAWFAIHPLVRELLEVMQSDRHK